MTRLLVALVLWPALACVPLPPPTPAGPTFAEVEALYGEPQTTNTSNCGGGVDKYGAKVAAWRCTRWEYAERAFLFDAPSRALLHCYAANGQKRVLYDPEVLRLSLIATGDPALTRMALAMGHHEPAWDTVTDWREADCSALLAAVPPR